MKIVLLAMIILFDILIVVNSEGQLKVGFYNQVCPNAESVVTNIVRDAAKSDHRMAAALLRLHFHDCFVEGCDGSILVDVGSTSERDIVAMAARDAVAFSHGPVYQVETGRKDGLVSNIDLASRMPDVTDSIQLLKQKFIEKGLNDKDLVILSAAHTIGSTACFFMEERLYNFATSGRPDPSINPRFLPELTSTCPKHGDIMVRLPMDHGSEDTFDIQILQNIRSGFAVLQSDAKLMDDPTTRGIVESYFGVLAPLTGPSFEADFVTSMIRMGRIGVKNGSNGNIRRVCKSFN
ncbi:hypothetical protein M8C21_018574 [Ambrosia artemisiifolia]|uniref:Peroxidase n=1 Tax=Ambrosia artemisiifolia TaxID=4212 RepID=A0AAD5G7Q2_AMBAR|nr:hypothetical protein M8C21_018574 [Ambrosia artemisiifolia]